MELVVDRRAAHFRCAGSTAMGAGRLFRKDSFAIIVLPKHIRMQYSPIKRNSTGGQILIAG
jgi:hypothetical protein